MTEPTSSQVESHDETQDEIDKIMSEIEELQHEMDSVASSEPDEMVSKHTETAESLESSPTPVAPQAVSPPPAPREMMPESKDSEPTEEEILKDFAGEGEEPWLEETFANLKNHQANVRVAELPKEEVKKSEEDLSELEALERELEAEERSTQEQMKLNQGHRENPKPLTAQKTPRLPSTPNVNGSLSMTVRGDMTLALNYEDGRQQIDLTFNQEFICIQFADGMEFKVPIGRNNGS